MNKLIIESKYVLHLNPIDGLHMSDYDFECAIYVYTNKRVVKKKSEMIKDDDDNYIVIIEMEEATRIGAGPLKFEVTAYIPDSDFSDGFRTEKILLCPKAAFRDI